MVQHRRDVPATALEVAYAKKAVNVNRAVPITGTGNEVVIKDSGQVVIRRQGRGGARITSSKARALSGCKGKRGCDFAGCVQSALGHAPSKLMSACK